MASQSICLRAGLTGLLFGFAATGVLVAGSDFCRAQEALQMIQPNQAIPAADSGLSASLYIDAKKNNQFADADPYYDAFAYTAKASSGEVAIRLDNQEILDLWKGSGTITSTVDGSSSYFEDAAQFAPVFLVLDLTNNGRRDAQITRAYLDIEASISDLQPYIDSFVADPSCMNGFDPSFTLLNHGWGQAQNGTLTFAFGDQSGPKTRTRTIDVGDLGDAKELSGADSFKALGIDTDKLTKGDFHCGADKAADRCLADWQKSDLLRPLAGAVFANDTYLFSRLTGQLNYDWTDSFGAAHKRTSPVAMDFLLLNVGPEPECGAGGPTERDFATFKLPLDKANVRIPLKLADKLTPRQEKRYGINLVADKSSHHRFRFIFELADGTTVASSTADLEYFTPHMAWTN